jgi:CRISPR/Cas system Type II protein with McrA/HNH and RuvC-like nuclease domain
MNETEEKIKERIRIEMVREKYRIKKEKKAIDKINDCLKRIGNECSILKTHPLFRQELNVFRTLKT